MRSRNIRRGGVGCRTDYHSFSLSSPTLPLPRRESTSPSSSHPPAYPSPRSIYLSPPPSPPVASWHLFLTVDPNPFGDSGIYLRSREHKGGFDVLGTIAGSPRSIPEQFRWREDVCVCVCVWRVYIHKMTASTSLSYALRNWLLRGWVSRACSFLSGSAIKGRPLLASATFHRRIASIGEG